ncbi:hypothetical protein CW713_07490 [Methanophagales archaeon]|nr:MAG: hypothetical protein CW713_07490 [Methanophagales archaeon]
MCARNFIVSEPMASIKGWILRWFRVEEILLLSSFPFSMPSKARDNRNQKYFIRSVIFTLRNGIYLDLKQRSKIDYAEFGDVWTVGKYNYI